MAKLKPAEIKILAMEVLKRLGTHRKTLEQENMKKRKENWETEKPHFRQTLSNKFSFLTNSELESILNGVFKQSFERTIETLPIPLYPTLENIAHAIAFEDLTKDLPLETLVENFVNKYK